MTFMAYMIDFIKKVFYGLNKNCDIHTQNMSQISYIVTCGYHYLISFCKNPFYIAMMTLLNHNLVLPWINTITLLFWYQIFQLVWYRWIHKGLESKFNQFKSTIITPFVALYVFHSIWELYLIPQVV